MPAQRTNRVVLSIIIGLSLAALITVATGYFQPPQTDEGTGAHFFQLSIVALVPTLFAFFLTADWKAPIRALGRLALPAGALVIAFGALYYLEHFR